jgi:phage gp16-like protein
VTAPDADAGRNRDLARIHVFKKGLGLDDGAYRDLLGGLTGKTSAKDLDGRQRWRVICEMSKLLNGGGAAPGKGYPGRPPANKAKDALIGKIEAHLADAKRPWAYANAMAKRMFGVDVVQWCDCRQLHKLVAALEYDQKRRKERQGAE